MDITLKTDEILHLINGMSPYLLLGFGLAGLMHAFIPGRLYARYLSAPNLRSVLWATLFGIPLPLCSCGVIPTAMSLRREGASRGAVTAFLVATPQTGVDSIIATYSLMGWPFALVRPVAALCTAVLAGTVTHLLTPGGAETPAVAAEGAPGHDTDSAPHRPFGQRMAEALRYAYVEMMGDIGKWLAVGLVVAALITVFVPTEWFAIFQGNTWASMALVLCISVPMYLCATGSIPIAVALMLKGLTPGAALVLLMAGPACNVASLLVVRKVLGLRTLTAYIASIVLGAVGFGVAVDALQFGGTVDFLGYLTQGAACCHEGMAWWMWASSAILLLLLLNALVLPHFGMGWGRTECGCHCHDHAAESGATACGDGCHGHCHCHDEEGDEVSDLPTVRLVVRGMTCSHCAAAVGRALRSVEGVTDVTVSQAAGEAVVSGNAEAEELMKAVDAIGFEADLKG